MEHLDLAMFKDVESSAVSPVYAWIWNSPVTRGLIKEQLDEMLEQGIRAVYILPEPKEFRPDSMVTHLSPAYLSDAFFELVRYAVEYAASLRISMWLYDEGGWPSGNACGAVVKKDPALKAKCIGEKVLSLNAGDVIEKGGYISVFTKDYQKLALPYTADRPCEVYAYYIKACDNGFAHIIDQGAAEEFIRTTYEGYKKHLGDYFGTVITAIFTDEPLIEYPYYIGDVTEFEKQYGYSFEECVYILFADHLNGEQKQFRVDYIEYCSRVFEERFVKRLGSWCKSNHILFTGHFDGDNTLGGHGFKRQVGNVMSHLRCMDIPGVDVILRQIFPGREDNTFFPRFASSAAHQTGKNLCVSESFAVYGNGVTFEQMRYVCNYQFVRGVNIINFMSVTSGRDRCLSQQCRPHFIPELPEAAFRKPFNAYISRMMYVCRFGELQCDAALYMPMRDVWAGDEACERAFWEMGRALEEQQVYFDIIDDAFISKGVLNYKEIYVPKTTYISGKARAVLETCGAAIHYSCINAPVQGLVKCCNRHIRVMKRKTGTEAVYVIFNEHSETVTADITFFEDRDGYVLNCLDGSISLLQNTSFKLHSGEAAVVLFTSRHIEAKAALHLKYIGAISRFDVTPLKKAEFAHGKLCLKTEQITIDERFCGNVRYTAYFDYDGSGDIVLDLGAVYYYAQIIVNGTEIQKLVMPPYTALIKRAYLQRINKLEIIVSNTAANAYVYANYDGIAKSEIGPYHECTLAFERESLGFGIKKIKLFESR